ncbi:hypothetical protein LTR66_014487, partial [Elasticomyces elasticus]
MSALKLLQQGLLQDYMDLGKFPNKAPNTGRRKRKRDAEEVESDSDDDNERVMEEREHFVKQCLRKARKQNRGRQPPINSIAAQTRKDVIASFLQNVALAKKCTKCQ